MQNDPLILPSPAKLNLMLHILGRREDGYHELQTLFQFLDYGDEMTFSVREDGEIRLLTEFAGVPHDHSLIVKAARQLQAQSGCTLGIDIQINKILPMGGNRRRKFECRHHITGPQSSVGAGLERGSTGGTGVEPGRGCTGFRSRACRFRRRGWRKTVARIPGRTVVRRARPASLCKHSRNFFASFVDT